jgi:hypothetical protein
MLRQQAAMSPIQDFTSGQFLPVIPDHEVTQAGRVLVATGKIVHELCAERKKRGDTRTAIVAFEQLYPFPEKELAAAFNQHPAAREVVGVQEEPANMGALFFLMPRLRRLAGPRAVRSVKRSASPSPASGSGKAHEVEQKTCSPWRSQQRKHSRIWRRGNSGRRSPHPRNPPSNLFADHTAGNTRSGVAGGVGFHIVGVGVDDKGRTLRMKKRVRSITQRDTWNYDLDLSLALGVHGQVLQVARVVPLRVLPSVLLAFGIEVAARALEVRRIALAHRVDVEAMHARGKV